MTQQIKVEDILKDNPLMARNELLRKYFQLHTNFTDSEINLYLVMSDEVAVDNIMRYARRFREKLGIRDEVRQNLAEEAKRYDKESPNLEYNPPRIQLKEMKQPILI